MIDWLHPTGCRSLVLHVDSVDANQSHLAMGAEPEGLTREQVQAIISAVSANGDFTLVGFALGEFLP